MNIIKKVVTYNMITITQLASGSKTLSLDIGTYCLELVGGGGGIAGHLYTAATATNVKDVMGGGSGACFIGLIEIKENVDDREYILAVGPAGSNAAFNTSTSEGTAGGDSSLKYRTVGTSNSINIVVAYGGDGGKTTGSASGVHLYWAAAGNIPSTNSAFISTENIYKSTPGWGGGWGRRNDQSGTYPDVLYGGLSSVDHSRTGKGHGGYRSDGTNYKPGNGYARLGKVTTDSTFDYSYTFTTHYAIDRDNTQYMIG